MQTTGFDINVFLIITTVIILLLAGLIFTLFYLYQHKLLKYNHKILDLTHSYEKSLLEAQIEIQETTFQQISHEIHDNITNSMYLLKMYLRSLDLTDPKTTIKQIESSMALLESTIGDLNGISKGLNSELISQQGLVSALQYEVAKIRKLNTLDCVVEVKGCPVALGDKFELIIFRIIQESMTNIVKHAEASKATIQINYTLHTLDIAVKDNGKGLPPSAELKLKTTSAGLKNMAKRIVMLNGSHQIESSKEGTIITLSIPHSHDKSEDHYQNCSSR